MGTEYQQGTKFSSGRSWMTLHQLNKLYRCRVNISQDWLVSPNPLVTIPAKYPCNIMYEMLIINKIILKSNLICMYQHITNTSTQLDINKYALINIIQQTFLERLINYHLGFQKYWLSTYLRIGMRLAATHSEHLHKVDSRVVDLNCCDEGINGPLFPVSFTWFAFFESLICEVVMESIWCHCTLMLAFNTKQLCNIVWENWTTLDFFKRIFCK